MGTGIHNTTDVTPREVSCDWTRLRVRYPSATVGTVTVRPHWLGSVSRALGSWQPGRRLTTLALAGQSP